MTRQIDLWDVQGNIVRAYSRFGYPRACHLFFNFASRDAGRGALALLIPDVTKAVTWRPSDRDMESMAPEVTLNVGLSWRGLQALGLPTASLSGMPEEFIDGMARRAPILSDQGASDPSQWDPIWRDSLDDPSRAVHLWVALNGRLAPDAGRDPFEEMIGRVKRLARSIPGLTLLGGHGRDGADEQRGGLQVVTAPDGRRMVMPFEHFGFADGISDPSFEGQVDLPVDASVTAGRGRFSPTRGWQDLATGEFILGHVDESQEIASVSRPAEVMRNGSFAVFRKLEQDVAAFDAYVSTQAERYTRAQGVGVEAAAITLRAKMIGRWPNGAPLSTCPTYADMQAFQAKWADILEVMARPSPRSAADRKRLQDWRLALNDFTYREDRDGVACPLGAHIRRGNPRDMLDPLIDDDRPGHRTGSALTNRRRILRRGIPYGPFRPGPEGQDQDRGILFIAICADLQRQFEFVQQQWMNHGMDMGAGNNGCPMIGRREAENADAPAFVIPQPAGSGRPPYLLPALPDFVRTKGGEYFFLPSMTALHTITRAAFDPT